MTVRRPLKKEDEAASGGVCLVFSPPGSVNVVRPSANHSSPFFPPTGSCFLSPDKQTNKRRLVVLSYSWCRHDEAVRSFLLLSLYIMWMTCLPSNWLRLFRGLERQNKLRCNQWRSVGWIDCEYDRSVRCFKFFHFVVLVWEDLKNLLCVLFALCLNQCWENALTRGPQEQMFAK